VAQDPDGDGIYECIEVECTTNENCNDGLFCNGIETCDLTTNTCETLILPGCDNGLFCDGVETCNETTDSCDV
jgi:hypothetical protein